MNRRSGRDTANNIYRRYVGISNAVNFIQCDAFEIDIKVFIVINLAGCRLINIAANVKRAFDSSSDRPPLIGASAAKAEPKREDENKN